MADDEQLDRVGARVLGVDDDTMLCTHDDCEGRLLPWFRTHGIHDRTSQAQWMTKRALGAPPLYVVPAAELVAFHAFSRELYADAWWMQQHRANFPGQFIERERGYMVDERRVWFDAYKSDVDELHTALMGLVRARALDALPMLLVHNQRIVRDNLARFDATFARGTCVMGIEYPAIELARILRLPATFRHMLGSEQLAAAALATHTQNMTLLRETPGEDDLRATRWVASDAYTDNTIGLTAFTWFAYIGHKSQALSLLVGSHKRQMLAVFGVARIADAVRGAERVDRAHLGYTPIHLAALGSSGVFKRMLRMLRHDVGLTGDDRFFTHITDVVGMMAFVFGSTTENVEPARAESEDQRGLSVWHFAALSTHTRKIVRLLAKFVRTLVRVHDPSALELDTMRQIVTRSLFTRPADDVTPMSALDYAVNVGNADGVRALIDARLLAKFPADMLRVTDWQWGGVVAALELRQFAVARDIVAAYTREEPHFRDDFEGLFTVVVEQPVSAERRAAFLASVRLSRAETVALTHEELVARTRYIRNNLRTWEAQAVRLTIAAYLEREEIDAERVWPRAIEPPSLDGSDDDGSDDEYAPDDDDYTMLDGERVLVDDAGFLVWYQANMLDAPSVVLGELGVRGKPAAELSAELLVGVIAEYVTEVRWNAAFAAWLHEQSAEWRRANHVPASAEDIDDVASEHQAHVADLFGIFREGAIAGDLIGSDDDDDSDDGATEEETSSDDDDGDGNDDLTHMAVSELVFQIARLRPVIDALARLWVYRRTLIERHGEMLVDEDIMPARLARILPDLATERRAMELLQEKESGNEAALALIAETWADVRDRHTKRNERDLGRLEAGLVLVGSLLDGGRMTVAHVTDDDVVTHIMRDHARVRDALLKLSPATQTRLVAHARALAVASPLVEVAARTSPAPRGVPLVEVKVVATARNVRAAIVALARYRLAERARLSLTQPESWTLLFNRIRDLTGDTRLLDDAAMRATVQAALIVKAPTARIALIPDDVQAVLLAAGRAVAAADPSVVPPPRVRRRRSPTGKVASPDHKRVRANTPSPDRKSPSRAQREYARYRAANAAFDAANPNRTSIAPRYRGQPMGGLCRTRAPVTDAPDTRRRLGAPQRRAPPPSSSSSEEDRPSGDPDVLRGPWHTSPPGDSPASLPELPSSMSPLSSQIASDTSPHVVPTAMRETPVVLPRVMF